ncbi:MAG: hypothetical protein A2521_14195 [Deltaproteobacteria bacterium RIFOXYD12_FULL_57_12]|nr:MAG: hypothetical protein A2521_14195 [Deltaproteobacteria bacterium RIFOXYD12_FULL_57_12]
MENVVKELKKIVKFKDATVVGDIVLVAAKDPRMLAYALVTDIVRDDTKRDEWWFVTLQFLTVPIQKVAWILRTAQLTGMEIFTMDGAARFVKAVDFGEFRPAAPTGSPTDGRKTPLRLVK